MHRCSFVAVAALVAVALHAEPASALADGYYDSTWIGGGRTTFQGDEIGKDLSYPPGSMSRVDRIFVGSGGELTLFGAVATTDTWIGGMHPDGSWIPTFGLSNGYGRTTLCYLLSCNPFRSATVLPDGEYTILGGAFIVRTDALAPSTGSISAHFPPSFTIDNVAGHVDATLAVAAQPDGKVLAGGSGFVSQADSVGKFGVVRFASSGFAFNLDTTFNSTTVNEIIYSGGAVVDVSPSDGYEIVTDILVQADGRIVLVGDTPLGEENFGLELARLHADGTPDPTFGTNGTATFTWAGGQIYTVGRARLDRAGRTVVALAAFATAGGQPMLVGRITADGQLDPAFGSDAGFARFSAASNDCTAIVATAVDIDSAGRILVTGDCRTPSSGHYFIAVRLRGDNGSVDTTFGINGYGLGAFASGDNNDTGLAIAFDGSGHPIIGGMADATFAGLSRLSYDLVYTNDFELAPRGCLPPDCN